MGKRPLERQKVVHSVDKETLAVHEIKALARLPFRETIFNHCPEKQRANPDPCPARSQDGNAVIAYRGFRYIYGGEQRTCGNDSRTLDVIVECAEPLAI